MNKIPVLIGLGPNNIEVPCRVFGSSLEEAKEFCDNFFGIEGVKIKNWYSYDDQHYDEEDWYSLYPTGNYEKHSKVIKKEELAETKEELRNVQVLDTEFFKGKTGSVSYKRTLPSGYEIISSIGGTQEENPEDYIKISYEKKETSRKIWDFGKKLYTHYYGGCGEIHSYKLVLVETNKPFVKFDLD